MKRPGVYLALLSVVVALLAFVILDTTASRAQAKRAGKPGVEAAKRNALLSTQLTWTFGSKQQRGWYIYTPLIKRLINTKNESDSPQFGLALGRWQAKTGLSPNGILDEETL